MAATELNFGPEWLRALSDGVNKNNSNSNSGSSSINNSNRNNSIISKTKIISKSPSSSSSCSLSSSMSSAAIISSNTKHGTEIKYRYSKDEMLSYFNRSLNIPVPKDLMQHEEVFVENAQNPLALVELTPEEMNLISQGINSDFVSKKSISTEPNALPMVDNSNGSTNNAYNKEQINHSIRPAGSIHTERNKFGTNGFITGSSDRTSTNNSFSLRTVGGSKNSIIDRSQHGSANSRTTLRNTSNIVFTRLSSTDDSINNCTPKSNSVFIAKKGSGLQRSSNSDNNSNSSSLFMPSWRSGSLTNANQNNINNNNETKDWKVTSTINNATNNNNVAGSEVSKSWRHDIGGTNNANNLNSSSNSSKIGSQSHKERKDFFGDSLNDNTTVGNEIEISIGGRKGRNLENLHSTTNSNLNKPNKTFNRKFNNSNVNNEQNDLFKSSMESNSSGSNHGHHVASSSHRDHYGSMLDAERDLFGGRNNQTSNYDLFSSRNSASTSTNDSKNSSLVGLNRYSRDHKDVKSNLNNSPNYLPTKLYDRDRSNNSSIGYHRLSHQYDRFNRSNQSNSNNQGDEYDFFVDRLGGRNVTNSVLASDDEDYRRNSLPEWSLEDPSTIDVTRVGTFDASGAFHEAFDEEENFFKNEQNSTEKDSNESKADSGKMDHDNNYNTNENDEKNVDSQIKKLAKLELETSNDGVNCVSKSKIEYFIDSSSSRTEDSNKNIDSVNKNVNIHVGSSTNVLESNEDKNICFDNNSNNTSGEMKNIGDKILNERIYSKHYEQNHLLKDTHHDRDFNNTNLIASTFHENNFSNDSLMSVLKQSSDVTNSSLLGETSTSTSSSSSSLSSTTTTVAASSSSSLFGSLLNAKNNVITSDHQPPPLDPSLTEDELKMLNYKLFSNDFTFDFCTSGSSTLVSNSIPVMTANNNNDHEMFLQMSTTMKNTMLTPVSQVLNRNSNTNAITFINNNNAAIGTSASFETNNLLNLVETNSDQTQTFDQQIFSNILSRSSVDGQSPTTLGKQSNLMGKEMIKSNSIDETSIHLSSMTNWLYCDPQGHTQGPFTNQEMYEWYHERYFAPELLVRRTTDSKFIKLGDLIQACDGRCPFAVPVSPQPQSAPISLSNHEQSTNFSMTSDAPGGTSLFTNLILPNQPNDSPIKTAAPNQQTNHSVSMMNQYLTSKTQSTNSNSFVAGTGSFSINDSMINHPFEFYQNMKQNSMSGLNVNCTNEAIINHNSSINRENNLLTNDNHLIDLTHHQVHSASNKLSNRTPISQMANSSENSMRMFFNNLIPQSNSTNAKDDLLAMNTQSREQLIPENYHLSFNKDQIKQTLNEYHINSCLPGSNSNSNKLMHSIDNDQLSTTNVPVMSMVHALNKPALDDSSISKQNNAQLQSVQLQSHQTYDSSSGFIEQTHMKSSFQDQDLINKEDPLELLTKYAAATANTNHNNTSSNFVLGAISVTAVEELQRREAEERYHSQKQQQLKEETDYIDCENEFIEVDRKQKHRQQQQNKQNQKKCSEEKVAENKAIIVTNQQQPTTSSPPPVRTPPISLVMMPQMSQLPKKAVWGNPSTTDNVNPQQTQHQPLSIAEIQKLQEQKDEEDRRTREIQINANIQQQRSLKWASQPWQEQNNFNVKTLAEIQAEEAEKQATLIRQQETESIRRRAISATSTSTMVAKGYGNNNQTSAWNNNNNGKYWEGSDSLAHQLSGQQIVNNNCSTKNSNAISSAAVSSINYKNALAASSKSNKIDSGLLKQMLRTNPKVMKKCEDSQLMKYKIDTYEELLRCCTDLLNKHFDAIDAPGFISILKDLGSPSEVSEYCQSYLGNNAVSQCFSKFFITKKSYLFKLKQEQERTKQQQPKKNAWNTLNTQSEEPDQEDQQRVNNYKLALNNSNNNNNTNCQLSGSSKNFKNGSTSKVTSCNITAPTSNANTATLKTLTSKTKINEDVNIMTMQVESMEDFDKWCLDVLNLNFEINIDGETFINFLKDIASPDEINDYVQTYLGNNKTSRDFAKYFISKRSYLRNKAKQSEPYEDMCGPAPALTPLINASSNNDNNGFVTVSSSSKKKRNKNKNQNHPNE